MRLFRRKPIDAIVADTERDTESLKRVLGGEAGPFADLVAVNAGAAIMVAGLSETIADGIAKARNSISSGKAMAALEALRRSSNG